MTDPAAMPSVRRRPIPGMTRHRHTNPSPPPPPDETPPANIDAADEPDGVNEDEIPEQPRGSETGIEAASESRSDPEAESEHSGPVRWPAADYAATRLTNFRIPVDLHDRYRRLVQEVERQHPRLRRPSLTEIIIGLLEEGPTSVDDVAELIRRKRASEYAEEPPR